MFTCLFGLAKQWIQNYIDDFLVRNKSKNKRKFHPFQLKQHVLINLIVFVHWNIIRTKIFNGNLINRNYTPQKLVAASISKKFHWVFLFYLLCTDVVLIFLSALKGCLLERLRRVKINTKAVYWALYGEFLCFKKASRVLLSVEFLVRIESGQWKRSKSLSVGIWTIH